MKDNQELFAEMLGLKKARGQDISDMLLRFSGSQGNTLGEKFQNYTAATATAGDWTTVVEYSQFANNGQTGANEALPFSPWNSNY